MAGKTVFDLDKELTEYKSVSQQLAEMNKLRGTTIGKLKGILAKYSCSYNSVLIPEWMNYITFINEFKKVEYKKWFTTKTKLVIDEDITALERELYKGIVLNLQDIELDMEILKARLRVLTDLLIFRRTEAITNSLENGK